MEFLHDALPPSIAIWAAWSGGGLICYAGGQRDHARYRESLPLVLLNLVLLNLCVIGFCALRGAYNPFADHGALWVYLTFFVGIDALSWFGHWAMHTVPALGRQHLRIHHARREPIGIEQFYQHPIDNFVLFIIPGAIMCWLLPVSVALFSWVMALSVLGNVLAHGPFGWEHRRHHQGEDVSLGGGVWVDWAIGTSSDTLGRKLGEWAGLAAMYFAFVHWPWALLLGALVGAFKLTLYFVTEVRWLRQLVWRGFYGALDRVLLWSGHGRFNTLNWGYSPSAEGPVEHPRELHLALYDRVVGDEPVSSALLEVGSGRGGGALHLAIRGFQDITGLDFSPRHVDRARQEASRATGGGVHAPLTPPRFVRGDAESLPFPDRVFDVVLNVESSHCYPNFDAFVDECARVLKPGGRLRLCDFRTRPEWERVLARFVDDPRWIVREHEDLTRAVLNACERLTPWYRPRMRVVRWLPPLYETLHNFACLEGSRNYRMFAEGRWVYARVVLERRPTATRPVEP